MFLILNPEVQKKCQKELDQITETIPNLSEMDNLNYCQATILGMNTFQICFNIESLIYRGSKTWLYSSWYFGPQGNEGC